MRTPFSPPAGLVTDDTAFSAQGWVDMDMARFWRDRPQTIGGWENFVGSTLTGVCRNVLPWNDSAGVLNVAFGTHTNLQVYVGGALYDITPSGLVAGNIDGAAGSGWGTGTYSTGNYSQPSTGDYFPRTWSLHPFGQTLIANPRNGTIYQWNNNTGSLAAALSNAPAKVTSCIVTPQRQIMALGANQYVGGVYDPLNVRWSDLEQSNVWLQSSANNAGEQHLEGGGRIVAGKLVGDFVFIWTDTALWQAQYIGDPGQTYRFTKLGEHCGLIGPNAAAVLGQQAYWLSPDGNFRTCALNGEPNLILSPVQASVAANLSLSQQDKIVASVIPDFNEIWWFYPDMRDGVENSRHVGVSVAPAASTAQSYMRVAPWLHGTMARTAFDEGAPLQWPLGVDYAGNVYLHEKGSSADGAPLSWFYESAGQALGEGDQRMLINGVWPDFQSQQGPVNLTIYTRDYPQSKDRIKGPWSLAPGRASKDFQADARVARVRISGSASPTFCRLGKLEFDLQPSGLQ